MAPDRGGETDVDAPQTSSTPSSRDHPNDNRNTADDENDTASVLASRAAAPQNFTIRSLLVGLLIGVVIAFSNTYFGLQTGWVSGMVMPAALIGFAFFRAIRPLIQRLPFTPVENVLVQTVAGSVGTMPLGCGFVGVIPALEYLLREDEGGPLRLSLWRLIVWAVGVCFFGVVFAVPLRREVIIREKLKFPSGTATALMIGVLHGEGKDAMVDYKKVDQQDGEDADEDEEGRDLVRGHSYESRRTEEDDEQPRPSLALSRTGTVEDWGDWKMNIKRLLLSFAISGFYTLVSYFIPQLHRIPFLGLNLARDWLWTLNPSPAYVGQGVIMGPATTLHMLLGAVLGWGVLSPLAKAKGWAPGPVSDWTTGSKGWIVWISLAIMLADSFVSLGWLIMRPAIYYSRKYAPQLRDSVRRHSWRELVTLNINLGRGSYTSVSGGSPYKPSAIDDSDEAEDDAPPEHLISTRTTLIGAVLSLALCVATTQYSFRGILSIPLTLLALLLALLLSIMGVRALGETDLNPVSGISKLTQLLFALVTRRGDPNAVAINLIAGAISESGTLQAGDLMQDLKAGHLLGASPAAQFWGQLVGSAVGAVVSALVYRLYTSVYEIPGGLFQVPTGYVWIFTARLVTGDGLPPRVAEWALGAGAVWVVLTVLRTAGNAKEKGWVAYVPGGIAVAVGESPRELGLSMAWSVALC